MKLKTLLTTLFLILAAATGTAYPGHGGSSALNYGYGVDDSEQGSSVSYSDLEEKWNYSKKVKLSDNWDGNLKWEGTHKVFSFQMDTEKLVREGKIRSDCSDIRIAWREQVVPTRIQAGDCGSEDTWVYFSNAREGEEIMFNPGERVEEITVFYGNRNPGKRHESVSPSNNGQATYVHPEGPIEMYYGTHQSTTYVNHDTHLHDEGVSSGEGYQTWHVDFQSSQYGDQPPDFISISDNDGNSATVSNPGDTYTINGNDYSWIDEGEPISVYFEVWDVESSTVTNDWPITNRAPNQPSNPDPAQSTSTSPVYTTSPNLNIDVSDPDGDDMDVTFFRSTGGSFTVNQGGNTWDVNPYTSSQGSGNYYPGPVSGSSDFLIAGYRDTSTGDESLIFGTEADSNMDAQLDLQNVPSGSSVTRTDDADGAGNSRHSRDELSLSHEPEGDWGWGSCCTDGGALQLGGGWTSITVDPDTSVGVGPNFVFYDSDGSRIDLDKTQQVTISSGGGTIGTDSNVNSGNTASVEWSGLTEGQSYDWYARACDPSGECTFSDTFTFEVSEGPLRPDNPDPSDTSNIYAPSGEVDLSARYRHSDGSGPGTLTFYNDDGSTIGSCQADHNNRCSVTKNVNNGQRYDWYVVAEYNGQTATSNTWYFVTNTPPEEPENPSPTDGATSVDYNSVTLSADVEDVDGDDMDVTFNGNSPSDSFSQSTTVSGSGTATVTVNNLAEGETYNWDVTAVDSHGASNTSDTWSFTTNYLPTISNPQPTDGAYVSSDTVQLGIDVSDQDGDQTDIRIYDQNGNQLGSGSTSDGSQVRVNAQYSGLSFGNTYDWTVEANDTYGQRDTTYSFSVIGSGSFRSATGIDYEYSSIIKSSSQSSYFEYKVTNKNVNNKELETRLQGADAELQQYGGTSHTYTLNSGETKTFRIEVTEETVGEHTVDVVTEDLRLGVQNVDSMPILVREYPASDVQEVPGLMWLQVLFLAAGATVLYSALL